VLIALIDPSHIHATSAHAWFDREGRSSFATCPLTENGLLRIVGNPRYPTPHGSPSAVLPALESLRGLSGHEFWPDEISLTDGSLLDPNQLLSAQRLTDTYLLALAVRRGGFFATFDRRLQTDPVIGGAAALKLIA